MLLTVLQTKNILLSLTKESKNVESQNPNRRDISFVSQAQYE
ncbi:hypothetical protein [Helicobacter muridarum]|nr:hypothetical protein [Helicobacter muridarum]